jgi:hypothetical protein
MLDFVRLASDNLLSPMVLFFVLGLIAARLESDLEIPQAVGKALSLYLMLSIGFRGGAELAHSGLSSSILLVAAAAVSFSLLFPLIAYGLLRVATRLDGVNAAAVAAHYGSVSVVTFVTATAFLNQEGVAFDGYLVAMMALMETPAIISGLILARSAQTETMASQASPLFSPNVLREVLVSGAVLLLLGSLMIGWITGEKGMEAVKAFVLDPFKGLLCLFLLDMGLLTARRLSEFRAVGAALFAFGLYVPILGGLLGIIISWLIGLNVGSATLFGVLTASASYIAVPAAMRHALPQANPSIYVTLSLGVTFPFNVTLGIPLYYSLARFFIRG